MLSSSPLIQISLFDAQNKTSQRDLDEMDQLIVRSSCGSEKAQDKAWSMCFTSVCSKVNQCRLNDDRFCLLAAAMWLEMCFFILFHYFISFIHNQRPISMTPWISM